MNESYRDIMRTFTADSLPNLETATFAALELLAEAPLPRVDVSAFRRPLVVGSGNALAAARIMFGSVDAICVSEGEAEDVLRRIPEIDGMVIVSASGGKHAPAMARLAIYYGKKAILVTTAPQSPAERELARAGESRVVLFPKNREPYSYNVSTYLGMILSATGERAADIAAFIRDTITPLPFPDFSAYDKFIFILPPQFEGMRRMFQVKCMELFGRHIARDIETTDSMRHGATIVPAEELFVSFGKENTLWGAPGRRFYIPLPENAGPAAMMAIGYFLIGRIQAAHPPYFAEHLAAYVRDVSEKFGESVPMIVE